MLNKKHNNLDDKLNTASKLIYNLIRDANNTAELTNFNNYADKVETQINFFLV